MIKLISIAVLDLVIATIYGSDGDKIGKTSVKLKGDYALIDDVEICNGNTIGIVDDSISNPINLDFETNGIDTSIEAL